MNDLVTKIRSRGYWTVTIHPVEHQPKLVENLRVLEDAIEKTSVKMRGWDFPHWNPNEKPDRVSQDYVQKETDWDHCVEFWRACRSGQLFSICSIYGDWRNQSRLWRPTDGWEWGATFQAEDAIFRFVEIYEFAANWLKELNFQCDILISNQIIGLQNRQLTFSPRRSFSRFEYMCKANDFFHEETYTRSALFATPRDFAIKPTIQMFELFGWDVPEDTIRNIQAQIDQ